MFQICRVQRSSKPTISAALVAALLAAVATASTARADEVQLANGDRITGTIEKITPASVEVLAYGTILMLPRNTVITMRSDRPVTIVSAEGQTHSAYVAPGTLATGWTESAAAATQPITPPAPTAAGVAPIVAPSTPPVAVAAAKSHKLNLEPYFLPVGPHWKDTLALGAINTTGNTESTALTGSLAMEYKEKPYELTLKIGGIYGTSNGEQTDALAYNDNILRRTLPELKSDRLYIFAENHNLYDGIKGISFRTVTAAGLGYFVVDTEKFKVDLRAGPGYRYERYFSGDDESDVVGVAGLRATYQVSDHVDLSQDITYTTALDDINAYQITSESALNIKLPDLQRGLGLRFAFRDDYDNTSTTAKRNDTRLTAALTLDF